MATIGTTKDMVLYTAGSELAYEQLRAALTGTDEAKKGIAQTVINGVYICTDSGKLYVHGTEVRDTNALTSVTDADIKTVTVDAAGNITITQNDGNSQKGQIPTVTTESGKNAGIVSGDTLKGIADGAAGAAGVALTAAQAAKDSADAAQKDITAFKSTKGKAGGLAELDSSGKVPASQLPSYVDDVMEGYAVLDSKGAPTDFYKEAAHTTALAKESDKIYVDVNTNRTYRWSGTQFVQIKGDIVVGESTGNAYDGAKGAQLRTDLDTLQGNFETFNENQRVTGIDYDKKTRVLSLTVPQNSSVTLGTATLPSINEELTGLVKSSVGNAGVPKDDNYYIAQDVGGTDTYVRSTHAQLYTYIDSKIPDASTTSRGEMTTTQVGNLNSAYNGATKVAADTSKVTITPHRVDGSDGTAFSIPSAVGSTVNINGEETRGKAGLMTDTDKAHLDAVYNTMFWYQATVE